MLRIVRMAASSSITRRVACTALPPDVSNSSMRVSIRNSKRNLHPPPLFFPGGSFQFRHVTVYSQLSIKSAHSDTDAREEFTLIKRFYEVIVRSYVQACDSIFLSGSCRQHDDVNRSGAVSDALANRGTVYSRHHPIEHRHAGAVLGAKRSHGFFAVLRYDGAKAGAGNNCIDNLSRNRIVFGDHHGNPTIDFNGSRLGNDRCGGID